MDLAAENGRVKGFVGIENAIDVECYQFDCTRPFYPSTRPLYRGGFLNRRPEKCPGVLEKSLFAVHLSRYLPVDRRQLTRTLQLNLMPQSLQCQEF